MRKILKSMDKGILVTSIFLLVFGLINIVNASSQAVVLRFGYSLFEYFFKHAGMITLGLAFGFIIIVMPKKFYKKLPFLAYALGLLLLILLLLFGSEYQGNKNWLNLGSVRFQPSELAKPALIFFVAYLFDIFYKKLQNPRTKPDEIYRRIFIIVMAGAAYILIVLLQKDLGTSIIMTGIFGLMFLLSPIPPKYKWKTIFFVLIVFSIGILFMVLKNGTLLSPTQQARLDYKDPCSKYIDEGYQVCNGYIAINNGGIFGVGIGKSKQISYLPESHTDSVFAIIAEEWGLLTGTIIFICYIYLLYRIFNLARIANTIKGRYICYGVGFYIGIHIIINLGGLLGVMPLTGVPLPFLSYGGSFTLALVISLALVQRVSIETKIKKQFK